MPGPQPQPITLTEGQREMLEHLTRRTTSTRGLVRRACIVLAGAEGYNNEQTALKLGMHRQTARLWRRKWLAARERLEEAEASSSEKVLRECIEDVLADAPRSGTPASFTPEQVCRIVALACEDPREESGRPVTHWTTTAELADEAVKRGIVESISPRSVGRFLGRGGSEAPSGASLETQRASGRAGDL